MSSTREQKEATRAADRIYVYAWDTDGHYLAFDERDLPSDVEYVRADLLEAARSPGGRERVVLVAVDPHRTINTVRTIRHWAGVGLRQARDIYDAVKAGERREIGVIGNFGDALADFREVGVTVDVPPSALSTVPVGQPSAESAPTPLGRCGRCGYKAGEAFPTFLLRYRGEALEGDLPIGEIMERGWIATVDPGEPDASQRILAELRRFFDGGECTVEPCAGGEDRRSTLRDLLEPWIVECDRRQEADEGLTTGQALGLRNDLERVMLLYESLPVGAGGRAEPPARGECTGLAADWCPNHGQCTCVDREDLNDATYPLHGPDSDHAEPAGPPARGPSVPEGSEGPGEQSEGEAGRLADDAAIDRDRALVEFGSALRTFARDAIVFAQHNPTADPWDLSSRVCMDGEGNETARALISLFRRALDAAHTPLPTASAPSDARASTPEQPASPEEEPRWDFVAEARKAAADIAPHNPDATLYGTLANEVERLRARPAPPRGEPVAPFDWVPPKPYDWDDLTERAQEDAMRPVLVGYAIDPRSRWWGFYKDAECGSCGHVGRHHDSEDGNCETAFCSCRMFVADRLPAPPAESGTEGR